MGTRRLVALLAFTSVLALAVTACSGADDEARNLSERSTIGSAQTVKKFEISEEEVTQQPAGSVRRAFLRYWSDLQFQAWFDATLFYGAELRAFLGDDRLIGALQNQAAYFRSSRPRDIIAQQGTSGNTTLRFRVNNSRGDVIPSSMSWRREVGQWRIAYDPFLDLALSEDRQRQVQLAVDPTGKSANRRALAAGALAARLQGRFAASQQDAQQRVER